MTIRFNSKELFILFCALSFVVWSQATQAIICPVGDEEIETCPYIRDNMNDKSILKAHQIIFKGKVISNRTEKNTEGTKNVPQHKSKLGKSVTTFEVLAAYKGNFKKSVDVWTWLSDGHKPFTEGQEYIIFIDKTFYRHADCALPPPEKSNSSKVEKYLENYKATLDRHDEEIVTKQSNDAYLRKGQFLEDYDDFMNAQKVYETALEKQNWDLGAIAKPMQKCEPSAADAFKDKEDVEALMRYGRTLIMQQKFQDAFSPLCIATQRNSKEAENLLAFDLIKLNRQSEVGPGPYSLVNLKTDMDLSGMTLRNWTFSNLSFLRLKGKGTDFTGAIFKNAHLQVDLENVNFQNTVFENAHMNGELQNADFSGSTLHKSELSKIYNGHFHRAKISDSKLTVAKADFSNAVMPRTTLQFIGKTPGKIEGFKNVDFEEGIAHDMSFENVNFGASNLKNAHFETPSKWERNRTNRFSGADLSNAILKDAKLNGATYDCKTKFPAGFQPEAEMLLIDNPECQLEVNPSPPDHKISRYPEGDNRRNADSLPPEKSIPRFIMNSLESIWQVSYIGKSTGTCNDYSLKRYARSKTEVTIPDLKKTDLSYLDAFAAWLPEADLSEANLVKADFHSSNFLNASFKNADLTAANLSNSILDNADFSGANMKNVDLRFARLLNVNLSGTNLEGAIYDTNTIWPKNFDPVKAGMRSGTPVQWSLDKSIHMKQRFEKMKEYKIASLSESAEVHGIGVYGSGGTPDIVKITAEKKNVPLILFLTAYEPVKWNIQKFPEVSIEAIIISGENKQIIGEIPKDVKIYDLSSPNAGRPAPSINAHENCGIVYDRFEDDVNSITGKPLTSFQTRGTTYRIQ